MERQRIKICSHLEPMDSLENRDSLLKWHHELKKPNKRPAIMAVGPWNLVSTVHAPFASKISASPYKTSLHCIALRHAEH